ncbi:hypothetical protein COO60DRAFT_292299 [Scenedesmus sp. NREL 46B-D3]|nr:hypothetical protein COO60DRAFT_292299 [Scenedesmus sp. NREL 46B-D3]
MNHMNLRTAGRSWSTSIQAKRPCSRLLSVQVYASVHARWCLDVRYGCKTEATALLQEWVATVGSQAGITAANTRLSSGCLGVPESRLEMEVSFDSMADWEAFLSAVPFQDHKAWSQRIQSMVVDGSPIWQVHRSVPLTLAASSTAAAAASAAQNAGSGALRVRGDGTGNSSMVGGGAGKLVITDEIGLEDIAAWHRQQASSGSSTQDSSSSTDGPRDWKGEPMKLNPGDKLPFKFL